MKNNETGEFELTLGNKQLLSGFFIIVILFAVFFIMGFMVGRNSAPVPPYAGNREQAPAGTRPAAAPAPAPAESTPPAATEAPKEERANPSPSEAPPAAQPAAPSPAPQTVARTEASAPAPAAPAEPAPGEIYLQVTAVKPEVAETVAQTLKEKGFPTSLSPGPSGRTRVLVGPYTDRGKLGAAKAELERLGFSPFVKK